MHIVTSPSPLSTPQFVFLDYEVQSRITCNEHRAASKPHEVHSNMLYPTVALVPPMSTTNV